MEIDDVLKVFLHVQNRCEQYIFSQTSFLVIECASFFLKIENILILMITKEKIFEIF
jgi:hypothetical protein